MSSFPNHVENINGLKDLGVDVSEYLDVNGNVSIDSWSCDELVDLMGDVIQVLSEAKSQPTIADYIKDNEEAWKKCHRSMVNISELKLIAGVK